MKSVFEFSKAAASGGFFVVLPIVLVWMNVSETVELLTGIAITVSEFLIGEGLKGYSHPELVAVVVVVVVCLATRLLMRSHIGRSVIGFFERILLIPIPGYTVIRTLTRSFGGLDLPLSRFMACYIQFGTGIQDFAGASVLSSPQHVPEVRQ